MTCHVTLLCCHVKWQTVIIVMSCVIVVMSCDRYFSRSTGKLSLQMEKMFGRYSLNPVICNLSNQQEPPRN